MPSVCGWAAGFAPPRLGVWVLSWQRRGLRTELSYILFSGHAGPFVPTELTGGSVILEFVTLLLVSLGVMLHVLLTSVCPADKQVS